MHKKIKIVLFFLSMIGAFSGITQELYKTTQVKTDFFSSAPIEDIHAVSQEGISALNAETGEISFQVNIKDFQFRKSLMKEHFNENFMESDKYPTATFRGKIRENIDISKNGEFPVWLIGILDIHGIKKNREIPSRIRIQNGKINLKSEFDVACKDHNIKIPRILWRNIAEVVSVQVNANYTKL